MYEDVLAAMFPDDTQNIGLLELQKKGFAKGQLKGARTNIFNETNLDKAATEVLKSLSGGDMQTDDIKYVQNRAKWRSFIQLVVDTNSMFVLEDSSHGIKRRLTVVDFIYTFVDNPDPNNPKEKKKDNSLGERLISEENLSGILNLIIARAPTIVKERTINRDEESYAKYEMKSHSFGYFVDNFVEIDRLQWSSMDWQIFSDDLYKHFKVFVDKINGSELTLHRFSTKVNKLLGQRSTTIRKGFKTGKGFKGLTFNEDSFKDFIKIRNSVGCDYLVTDLCRDKSNTVSVVTEYKQIKSLIEKFRNSMVSSHAKNTKSVTDSEQNRHDEDKNNNSEPKNGFVEKSDTPSQRKEIISSKANEDSKKTKNRNAEKVITARINADCVFNGVEYKTDEVVSVDIDTLHHLPATIIVEFEKCGHCGKPFKYNKSRGRDRLCIGCFKLAKGKARFNNIKIGGDDNA
jgi:hypothetical protein